MIYERELRLNSLISKKSIFLFGPRSTGKTTLLRQQFQKNAKVINLLESDLYLRFSTEPELFRELVLSFDEKIVIVDEIQRIPQLLNEVHHLIESNNIRFLLTGSSARKLRHGQANLLAGRAWKAELFPLVYSEIKNHFNIEKIILNGTLPQVYTSDDPKEELKAYTKTYLYEEIQAEGIVRKIPQFSRFLKFSALSFGNTLNYAQLSSDSGVPASTLKEHYQILEDTLIGYKLSPFNTQKKRKSTSTEKFYFFDNGVTHALCGTQSIDRNSDLYGRSFEQWIINEIKAYISYRRKDDELSFWKNKTHDEVDLIIGDHTALEIKSSQRITSSALSGLLKIHNDHLFKNRLIVSQDQIEGTHNGIRKLYYKNFLELLWRDELF